MFVLKLELRIDFASGPVFSGKRHVNGESDGSWAKFTTFLFRNAKLWRVALVRTTSLQGLYERESNPFQPRRIQNGACNFSMATSLPPVLIDIAGESTRTPAKPLAVAYNHECGTSTLHILNSSSQD